ncbi:MAG TPA: hypothetical protein VK927_04865 [Adhaeribacter sp.]|nr:hypothetical protein [Adhaeribacter sp.]
MQDKQIREKLDSLNTLPEGYAPSLDSKWELLRAGQPEKKKRRLVYYYAAAASFLLLLVSGIFLNLKFASQPGNEVATTIKTAPEAKPAFSEISKNEANNQPAISALIPTEAKPENAIKKAEKTKVLARASVKRRPAEAQTEVPALPSSEPEKLVLAPEPAAIATTRPEGPAKKRHRYVELDFEAPEMPQHLPQPVQTAQLQFKIRLLPQPSEPGRTTLQQENPIRLQHTF